MMNFQGAAMLVLGTVLFGSSMPSIVALQDTRNLQTTLKANYVGSFSKLVDNSCDLIRPELKASCRGEIEFIRTSDPTIVCAPLSAQQSDPGWNEIRCINTCENQAKCDSIWLNAGGSFDDEDVYGEIFWSCTGETVESRFIYLDNGDGSCGNGNVFGDARNFHLAQMGVFCTDIGIGGDFDFSISVVDCNFGVRYLNANERMTCLFGENARNSVIEFEDIIITSEEHYFSDACLSSVNGGPISPRPAPAPAPVPVGEYTARFQARFGMGFNQFDVEESPPQVRATCTNGEIQFLGGLEDSVSCQTEGANSILCTDSDQLSYHKFSSGDVFIRQPELSGFVYTCKASQVPETKVDFLPNVATGDSADTDDLVWSALLLGVFCGDPAAGGDYNFYEHFYECDPQWDRDSGERLECFSSILQREGSFTIPQVTMFTDFQWSEAVSQGLGTTETCVTFQGAAPTRSPTLPPTDPTMSPTSPPTPVPTPLPTSEPGAPEAPPTSPPTPLPTPMPTNEPGAPQAPPTVMPTPFPFIPPPPESPTSSAPSAALWTGVILAFGVLVGI